jgi:transcriptional repressor NrdR
VYRNFASLEDFEGEIALLRALPSSNKTADKPRADVSKEKITTSTAPLNA